MALSTASKNGGITSPCKSRMCQGGQSLLPTTEKKISSWHSMQQEGFYFTAGSSPKAISGTKDAASQRGTAKTVSLFHAAAVYIASQVSLKYHRDCRDKLHKNMWCNQK